MRFEGLPAPETQEHPSASAAEFYQYGCEDDKPQDNCGVIAVIAPGQKVGELLYDGMQGLQHRGQQGAGVAYPAGQGRILGHNGSGLIDKAVPDIVPHPRRGNIIDAFSADNAIGHTRYSTADAEVASQPFLGRDFALAHNGHLETVDWLAREYGVDIDTAVSDSDIAMRLIESRAIHHGSLDAALLEITPQLNGAFCFTITDGERIIGVRDPWATHPLSIGRLPDGGHVIASETIAFKPMHAEFVRDVEPGEIVSINRTGEISSTFMDRQEEVRQCVFEYVYIARPESIIGDVKLARARENMGKYLAMDIPLPVEHLEEGEESKELVIVGVPRSGLYAADGFEKASGLRQERALIDDRYVGRSFIEREGNREDILRRKFTVDEDLVEGKRVILIDDSLIKGNTMRGLVSMVREAGAAEVHVRLAAPRYLHPCYGGLDTRQTWRLIARGKTDEDIATEIGADSVAFNSVERIEQSVNEARRNKPGAARSIGSTMCMGCVKGEYPYPVPPETAADLDLVNIALAHQQTLAV